MPFLDVGSLYSVINYKFPNGIKDEKTIAAVLKICLETLSYLHKRNYIHRDIKAGNILLGSNGDVKVGDFGVATKIKKEAKRKSFVGSCSWMPPEVISSEGYDFKFDIWSLGITAIELAQGKTPFFNLNEVEALRKIQFDEPVNLKDAKKHPTLSKFIKSCLVKNPKKRPSAKELLEEYKDFFDLEGKDKDLIMNLVKDIPLVNDRFSKYEKVNTHSFYDTSKSIILKKVPWKFDCLKKEEKEDCNLNEDEVDEDININTEYLEDTHSHDKSNTNDIKRENSEKFNVNNSFKVRNTIGDIRSTDLSNNNSSLLKSVSMTKKKMLPEIEEALKKKKQVESSNLNHDTYFLKEKELERSQTSQNKKFDKIKKIFDCEDN